MTADAKSRRPYKPNFIHTIYAQPGRFPIPVWLLILLLLPIIAIAQHLAAWRAGALPPGHFNFDLATAGYWLVGILLIGIYVVKAPAQALRTYRSVINVREKEYSRLTYNFVTIPNVPGLLAFILGLSAGAVFGWTDKAVAPAIDYVLPSLRIAIWMVGTGLSALFLYQVTRQLLQIRALYALPAHIDLFNIRPLYGFPRYTAALGIMIFLYYGLVPWILDPTAFASQVAFLGTIPLIPLILLMFYLPLAGVHRRLVEERDRLLEDLNARIAKVRKRIHAAAFEHGGFDHVGEMRTVLTTLMEERETVEHLSTWPWRPGTLTGLLSALLLPIVLVVVREIVARLLGS